jgi:hypothetical protein
LFFDDGVKWLARIHCLVETVAGGSELARRFHFGLAKGVGNWIEKEWDRAVGDPRREKVEKLVTELERQC